MLEFILGGCIVMYIRNFLQIKKREKSIYQEKRKKAGIRKTLEFSQTHSIKSQSLTERN